MLAAAIAALVLLLGLSLLRRKGAGRLGGHGASRRLHSMAFGALALAPGASAGLAWTRVAGG